MLSILKIWKNLVASWSWARACGVQNYSTCQSITQSSDSQARRQNLSFDGYIQHCILHRHHMYITPRYGLPTQRQKYSLRVTNNQLKTTVRLHDERYGLHGHEVWIDPSRSVASERASSISVHQSSRHLTGIVSRLSAWQWTLIRRRKLPANNWYVTERRPSPHPARHRWQVTWGHLTSLRPTNYPYHARNCRTIDTSTETGRRSVSMRRSTVSNAPPNVSNLRPLTTSSAPLFIGLISNCISSHRVEHQVCWVYWYAYLIVGHTYAVEF